jgi:hypothetical protein
MLNPDLAKKVAARHSRHKNAGVLEDSVLAAFRSGEVTNGPVVKSFEITSQGIVAHVEASVLLPETKETMKAALPLLPPAQVAKIVSTSPSLLADLSPEMLGRMSFKAFPDAAFVAIVKKVIQSGLSKYSSELLIALLEGREAYVNAVVDIPPSPNLKWPREITSFVSGNTPQILGYETQFFRVKNGVVTLHYRMAAIWENPRGLKVRTPVGLVFAEGDGVTGAAEVHLSRKVYPTADSVNTAFDTGDGDFEPVSDGYQSTHWELMLDNIPANLPGIVSISGSIDPDVLEAVPLTALKRNQLEGLVIALTAGNW